MNPVTIVRGADDKITGFGEKGVRAWERFKKAVEALEIGETLAFEWKRPRSPKFHKLFFATVGALLDRQEQFQTTKHLLDWLKVGAGRFMTVPGPHGKPVAMPESIAWHNMEDNEFYDFFMDVDAFMETEHFGFFLWPHLGKEQRQENINQLLAEFRSERKSTS